VSQLSEKWRRNSENIANAIIYELFVINIFFRSVTNEHVSKNLGSSCSAYNLRSNEEKNVLRRLDFFSHGTEGERKKYIRP
jgi:hypothetical protein